MLGFKLPLKAGLTRGGEQAAPPNFQFNQVHSLNVISQFAPAQRYPGAAAGKEKG